MIPPKVVLAAVDFSESSRRALTFAARLARHADARLHVVHAQDPLLAHAARAAGVDIDAETRAELSTFMLSAPPAGDWSPFQEVVDGPAVSVLADVADRENADVIVVGAHGMSGIGRLMFGSTTEGMLREADHSVFVIPDSWTPPRADSDDLSGIGPVVAGVEPTPVAIAAAHAADDLARVLGTSLQLLHVVPPPSVLSRWSAHAEIAQRERLDDARQRLRDAAAARNVTPEKIRVTSGAVAEQLAEAVREEGRRHPLLVLGRRSRADRGGTPGSTAVRVLTLAQVPVLMYLPDR
jgi:nucleotide-binding universal stress UspA family protein